jgi:predicted nucleic acid-binding protein
MSEVFADAFYFVARLNRHDQHHERTALFSLAAGTRLITSEWILLEVADALAKSEVRPYLRDIMHDLRRSAAGEIVSVSAEGFSRALDFCHQHRDKE